jgi:hypothetical protein
MCKWKTKKVRQRWHHFKGPVTKVDPTYQHLSKVVDQLIHHGPHSGTTNTTLQCYQNQIPRLKTLFIFSLFFDKFFFSRLIPLLFCFLCTRKYIPRANAQNSKPRKARGIFFVWIIYHPFPFLFLIFGLSLVSKINHFV